jgi:2,6-dihydroxypyridine 3-monooxygenase
VRDRGELAEVVLADGTTRSAELVVCADGIRSGARRALLPEVQASFAGYVAWRGVAPLTALGPTAAGLLGDAITYTIMDRSHLLTYPIASGEGRLVNWVWYHNVETAAELEALLTDAEGRVHDLTLPAGFAPAERVAALRARARGVLHDVVVETIEKTSEPFVQVVLDVEPSRLAFGRICLLGDAGFVARPHAAAGTAKACEDAWHLAAALVKQEDVPAALAAWEPAALELGANLVRRSREAGIRSQFDGTWQVGDPLPFGLYEVGDSEL